jgi:hypothetical protein
VSNWQASARLKNIAGGQSLLLIERNLISICKSALDDFSLVHPFVPPPDWSWLEEVLTFDIDAEAWLTA